MLDLVIKNGECFINGKLTKQDIGIKNGKITLIGDLDKEKSKNLIDAKGKLVLPGLMDTQVHFREPGSVDAEDLHTGSRAAIVGGITSVFEMPNTNPPTTNFEEFHRKINIGKQMYCNHAFYFGATAENYETLEKLKELEGCCGIKLFAGSSTGNLLVDKEDDIERVFKHASKVVAVHSEDEEILRLRKKLIEKGNVKSHPVWRNEEVAISSTRKIVKIAKRLNKKAHILHVTTKEEVDFLSQNKGNITFEITPQHLTMYAPECYDKLGSYAQMNPPIRDKSHYDRLWYAIRNDYNDTIGSDHAPHLKNNKEKSYPDSPSGMPGVQTILPVMFNHMNDGKIKLNQIIKLLCENPVKIFGILYKGYIMKDFDADFTIVDLNKEIEIKNENIESKCGWSPFNGYKFKGTPIYTIIGGEIKMKDGKIIGEPTGKPLSFK